VAARFLAPFSCPFRIFVSWWPAFLFRPGKCPETTVWKHAALAGDVKGAKPAHAPNPQIPRMNIDRVRNAIALRMG
jgi:hypothetical protein